MIVEIKIPSPGESISEVEILNWLIEDGDIVEKDQEIAEVESEKATLPLIAETSGKIKILAPAGQTILVGAVACTIDTDVRGNVKESKKGKPAISTVPRKNDTPEQATPVKEIQAYRMKITPLAQKMMNDYQLSLDDIISGLRKISVQDVKKVVHQNVSHRFKQDFNQAEASREKNRVAMTPLRKKLSKRLVAVKNETATLTTFNEVDMSKVIALRNKYQKVFTGKHGVKLGYMSFFTKAATEALKLFPNVNAMIDGEDIVFFNYSDIGIAVQTDKGLMVPVLRSTEAMSLADIEKNILTLTEKARSFKVSIDEMTGGTFTITNGGVFGSMLSTPIINPPQAGILGMHNIVQRPVAIEGKVEIRPIMYLALSYDHRLIDGRDSVGFLKTIKEYIEDPYKMILEGVNVEEKLLEL